MTLAPVTIFVYKRPRHTEKMLDSLLENTEVRDTPLTVYCDGPRPGDDVTAIAETRELVKRKLPHAEVVESDKNKGLSASIIEGVTKSCEQYGRTIVIEDDLILSPVFIDYMNRSLDKYGGVDRVMHISGYCPAVNQQLPPTFFYREPDCWGWATWQRAWQHFDTDAQQMAMKIYQQKKIKKFNNNHCFLFWEMLLRQARGDIDSWAIRWYAAMFLKEGLSLYPSNSLVQNRGFDASGEHCPESSFYDVDLSEDVPEMNDEVEENKRFVKALQKHRLPGIMSSLSNRLKHINAYLSYKP